MIVFITLFLGLVRGPQMVEVGVSENVDAVELRLDGELVGRLESEPWRMELDLGGELSTHELVAVARDARGREVGRAAQQINVPRSATEAEILLTGKLTRKQPSTNKHLRPARADRLFLMSARPVVAAHPELDYELYPLSSAFGLENTTLPEVLAFGSFHEASTTEQRLAVAVVAAGQMIDFVTLLSGLVAGGRTW